MKTISPPISLTIVASGGGTSLSALASSMSAGTWAQLTTATGQNATLGVGPTDGDMLPFCHKMTWNPINRKIEIIGADHNYVSSGQGTGMRLVEYDEASNSFAYLGDQTTRNPAHGYDHLTVNPVNGDLYLKAYGDLTSFTLFSQRRAFGGSSWTDLPTTPLFENVTFGTCWWTGTFTGSGAQGSFMVYSAGNANGGANDGQIRAFNPLSNTWFFSHDGMSPFMPATNQGTYHVCMAYSAVKNCAVYGGGNPAPNKLWRLNSDTTVTVMPDVPAGKAAGIQRGIVLADPVTGNFLLLSAGELWELNPTGSGNWTQQTGTRIPPAGVGILGPSPTNDMIGVALPDHGVVAYIKQQGNTGSSFWLYKHA